MTTVYSLEEMCRILMYTFQNKTKVHQITIEHLSIAEDLDFANICLISEIDNTYKKKQCGITSKESGPEHEQK